MPTLAKKLQDDLTEQWFMDSSVKQLQQVIPLKIQTMEIKFAPLQTAHLSRTFKLLPALGHFPALVSLPLENHFAFKSDRAHGGMERIMQMSKKRYIAKKNPEISRNAEVETINVNV